jgi:hypothetical protein
MTVITRYLLKDLLDTLDSVLAGQA